MASAPLTVPLEWPPPRVAALEMVHHALLDGVGDNGGGQPRSYRTMVNGVGDEGGRTLGHGCGRRADAAVVEP